MTIRECAARSAAFRRLLSVCRDREAAIEQLKSLGRPLIGTVGADVPDELLIAAGLQPYAVWSDGAISTAPADRYLEYAFDPMTRRQFAMLAGGKAKSFSEHAVISNSTDALIRAYFYLREIARTEPDNALPGLHFIDLLFTRRESYRKRSLFVLELFKIELEEICGHEITDDAIREASKLCNENRAALRELQKLRVSGEVSGCCMLVAVGAGFYMEKSEHTALIKELVNDAKEWPVLSGPKVFYTGSAQEDLWLYSRLEAEGLRVVGEDTDRGARSFDGDCDLTKPPLEAVLDRYYLRSYSSKKAFVSQRVEALQNSMRDTKADAALFYMNIYEEPASWDYPSQKRWLDSEGKPSAYFAKQQYPAPLNEGLADELKRFAEELKGGVC